MSIPNTYADAAATGLRSGQVFDRLCRCTLWSAIRENGLERVGVLLCRSVVCLSVDNSVVRP